MSIVLMMQMTIDEIVYMVTMRYSRMPAVGTMNVGGFMPTTNVPTGALVRIGCVYFK
jgi:hypothetical protein